MLDPNLGLQKRCKMQEIAGEKNAPPPTQEPRGKHRENAARGPHQPRGSKTPLGTKKKNKSTKWHGERLLEQTQLSADDRVSWPHPARAQKQVVKQKQQKTKTAHKIPVVGQSVLLTPVVLKKPVVGTMQPPPSVPLRDPKKKRTPRTDKG